MCRIEGEKSEFESRERKRRRWGLSVMGFKAATLGDSRVEKLKSSMMSRSRMKLWMVRATTSILLWTCVVQLMTLGETWGPRVLKGWPSCFSQESTAAFAVDSSPEVPARVLPPKSEYFLVIYRCGFVYSVYLIVWRSWSGLVGSKEIALHIML